MDLFGHALRQSLSSDSFAGRTKFRAQVLTPVMTLSALQARGITGTGGAAAVSESYAFRARILGENSPHAFLPDPCDAAFATNKDFAHRARSMHTLFLVSTEQDVSTVSVGDLVYVELERSNNSYNLEHGLFLSLLSEEAPPTAGSECITMSDFDWTAPDNPVVGSASDGGKRSKPQYDPEVREKGKKYASVKCTRESRAISRAELMKIEPKIEAKRCKQFDGGDNLWRCSQPTLSTLRHVASKGVKHIIKLNGSSGGDLSYSYDPSTGLCIGHDLEQAACDAYGMELHIIDAALGCKVGRGYAGSIAKINKVFDMKNALVHCTHGADRTGYAVAQKKGGDKEKLWEYTIGYNQWKNVVCKRPQSGFVWYLEGFYPVREFCKCHPECGLCKKSQITHKGCPTLDLTNIQPDPGHAIIGQRVGTGACAGAGAPSSCKYIDAGHRKVKSGKEGLNYHWAWMDEDEVFSGGWYPACGVGPTWDYLVKTGKVKE